MRTIHLYGKLRKFGPKIELEVTTAAEAVRALCVNFPEIEPLILEGSWRLVRGAKNGMDLGEEDIPLLKLGTGDLHIIPAMQGKKSRNGNAVKIVLGATLIAMSFGTASFLSAPVMGAVGVTGGMTWGAAMGMMGLSMVLTGVSAMLAPESKSEDETKSYLMSGPSGSVGQGNPVPLVYGGPLIVGSVMISGGIDIHQAKPL